MTVLVALATAWGPRFGGINAFNAELLKSVAIQPAFDLAVYCVLPGVTEEERESVAQSYHVGLVGLGQVDDAFAADAVTAIWSALQIVEGKNIVWLGHDDKTGPLALQLRDAHGGRAVLIHHMAHGAYQGFKKGSSESAQEKKDAQRKLFAQADHCFAVGPLLQKNLEDMLRTEAKQPPITMLVPGLDDPTQFGIQISATSPNYFGGFAAGRLTPEDDRIKQGRLALRGFASAVKTAHTNKFPPALIDSPRKCLMGVQPEQEAAVRTQLEGWADRQVQVSLLPFSEDRAAYYRNLCGSSFALMLSWHEGFGLTGWEAIAAEVPLVLGKDSGLYVLLRDTFNHQGVDLCIHPLAIAGHATAQNNLQDENHSEADVKAVTDVITKIACDLPQAKKSAKQLRAAIERDGWNWQKTAITLLTALELPGNAASVEVAPAPPLPPDVDPLPQLVPNWLRPPQSPVWNAAWGLSPAVLLQARAAIVPFDPARRPLLDELLTWANSSNELPIKVRSYTGAGGTGKTRLALEAIRLLVAQGWQAHWLAGDRPSDWAAQWHKLVDLRRPCLFVIDYAETRAADIKTLLQGCMGALGGGQLVSLRVILLARSAGEWWQEMSRDPALEGLLCGPATFAPQRIDPLPDMIADPTVRPASYRAAAQAFAAALGRAVPVNCYEPDLSLALYGRLLYVQLAALAALDGQRPASASALLENQINREWRHFTRAYPNILYGDWADALALVTLTGGCPSADEAASWFEQANLSGALPRILANALASVYPGRPGLAALLPDLLGETLVHQRLLQERGSKLLECALGRRADDTLLTLGRLCAENETIRIDLAPVLRAALGSNFPDWAQKAVEIAHGVGVGLGKLLALAWQSPSLSVNVGLRSLRMPDYSIALLDLAVLVARAHCILPDATLPQRAMSLNNLGACLSEQGGAPAQSEALACAREAVKIYRELVQQQPAAYLPNLAASLNNLANCLSAQGGAPAQGEALACSREAVKIYGELAQQQPVAFLPDLAGSLNNLANRLSGQGGAPAQSEALACSRAAVKIYRELAQQQPAAFLPDLAMSLNNLASRLSAQGGAPAQNEALACARESVKIRRELAQQQPSAFLPDLAGSLNNLAIRLSEQGGAPAQNEALACAREAVKIYRELAQQQPAAFLPNLAESLNNLASCLSTQGGASAQNEALACARETVGIYRELAQQQPTAFLPNLAISLNNLAIRLSALGGAPAQGEALACSREAVKIRRELAQQQPAAFLPGLAASLNNLANHLSAQGGAPAQSEALACAREAVRICRELAHQQPAAFLPDLAMSLNNLAISVSAQGGAPVQSEAPACAREAAKIYRELAQQQPTAFLPNLAASLNNLANHLFAQGGAPAQSEALACAREAVKIYRELAQQQPAAFLPDLAMSLKNLASHLSALGGAPAQSEALACAREAVEIYRELAHQQPDAYESRLKIAGRVLAELEAQ